MTEETLNRANGLSNEIWWLTKYVGIMKVRPSIENLKHVEKWLPKDLFDNMESKLWDKVVEELELQLAKLKEEFEKL